ncbi:MAG: 1-(5-phosphoribosyl)-5-[(5-phosphoribosylamino)methylideneamino]imidazole-4-carboxamide isomerase [Candidatus Lokiarchaeota archaeon]|nr:1-(5-phosphoribosyl)-5-[(5-phosphoribosylamino)methylideneamino]imidazole-4-carboxamide isomerase [Candidatus Lokiarchaeota archaeon]
MEIIPAIDISNGKCVRLYKGKKGTETIYFEDPLEALDFWVSHGAERLHFIDLDGAWGSDVNKNLLQRMIKKTSNKIKIQIGGGIRSIESALKLIELGADRIIIGTFAIKNPEGLKELLEIIGPDKLITAIDYRKEKVAIQGWTELSNKNPFSFGRELEELGVKFILFSSIEADGTLSGPDFENIEKMIKAIKKTSIYVAGGVRNIKDVEILESIGVKGVIIGKAFYERSLPFSIIKNSK